MKMEEVVSNQGIGKDRESKSRPRGIIAIAVINIIGGVIVALGSLGVGVDGEPLIALVGFGLGAFLIAVAVGLLKLKRWARIVAIIGYSINFLVGLAQLGEIPILALFSIGVALSVLIYLNTNRVKSAFGKLDQTDDQFSQRDLS